MFRAAVLSIFLFISAVALPARSAQEMQAFIDTGKDYLFRDKPMPDSALYCFSQVAESYSPQMTLRQKELCGTATNNLGFTYFYYYTDYRNAYESLVKAEKICNETGKILTTVNVKLNLGNVYSVFSEHVDSPELASEAEQMYIDAFEVARTNGLWHQMLSAFANLTSMGNDFSHIDSWANVIDEFGNTDIPPTTPNYNYCVLRYKALKAVLDKNYSLATNYLRAHRDAVNADMTVEAYHCQAFSLLSAIYSLRQMPDSAIFYAQGLFSYAVENDVAEAKANANRILEKCYREAGDDAMAKQAHINFIVAQDSLINDRRLGSIDNIKFLNELAAEKERAGILLAEAERKKKVREIVLFFALFILAIAIPLLLVILNRNRLLKASYQDLYLRYQEYLKQEDEKRLMREAEISTSKQNTFTVPEQALSNKTRILSVMDESDEIYSPDFSLERLAELVEMKPRVLSAILNDTFKTTFRDLLNSYRVREACRRLVNTDMYGNLTIEAISMSVGYKSRTSLISAFKRETGLTPSEYQKIALKS